MAVPGPETKTMEYKLKHPSPQPDLDTSKSYLQDPQDPRSQESWPCYQEHLPTVKGGNGYGSWVHCGVCGLRLSFTPRKGATAKHLRSACPSVVTKAFSLLYKDLRGAKPHHELSKAALAKAEADMVYDQLLGRRREGGNPINTNPNTAAWRPPHRSEAELIAPPDPVVTREKISRALALMGVMTGEEIAKMESRIEDQEWQRVSED